jgi:hypothetical protein
VLRRGHGPARVISDALIGDKVPKATRKQTIDLRQPSWLATVAQWLARARARWRLKEAAS